jgi:hypothetical protein
VVVALSACAPDQDLPEPAPGITITRQAMGQPIDLDGGRLVKGVLLAHLGTTLAPCPSGGYIAGAPGNSTAWFSPLARVMNAEHKTLLPSTPQYFPVACDGPSTVLTRGLIGGPDFSTNVSIDGGTSRFASFRVDSFAEPPNPSLPLAVGDSVLGAVTLFPSSAQQLLTGTTVLSGYGTSFSISMAWNLNVLAVGFPEQTTVTLATIGPSPDAGFTTTSLAGLADPNPMGSSDFGKVVVSGNVTPHPGDELIVSSPAVGRVYIFSGTTPVMTLSGGTSFGAALAVDPRIVGDGLHALWVGEPNAEQVHRFFGREATIYSAPAGLGNAHFGAALAVDSLGLLAVGAPDYNDGLVLGAGVVVEANIDGGTLLGQAMTCNAGASCRLPACTLGRCVGDVFCEKIVPETSVCSALETCASASNLCMVLFDGGLPDGSVDAGPADAGSADAGSADAGSADAGSADAGSEDAGSEDAGSVDAGSGDAGTEASDGGELADGGTPDAVTFRTCGCTSGGLPGLLLGLLLARRRRG